MDRLVLGALFCAACGRDGRLDTHIVGMPKKGVGVSGPPPSFIPRCHDARFPLDGDVSEHDIELKYL